MYQPAQLDSFIRLLICHLGNVLTQGEQLIDNQSHEMRLDLLQYAIEQGADNSRQIDKTEQQRDAEMLFALQMSQSREWVDRLGQLDPDVERDTDEFLAATFAMEQLVRDHNNRKNSYHLENIMTKSQTESVMREDLANLVDVDAMMCAIFELLGRLEDQYDLMEELHDLKQVVNGVPFGPKYTKNHRAKVIPLFGAMTKKICPDNDY